MFRKCPALLRRVKPAKLRLRLPVQRKLHARRTGRSGGAIAALVASADQRKTASKKNPNSHGNNISESVKRRATRRATEPQWGQSLVSLLFLIHHRQINGSLRFQTDVEPRSTQRHARRSERTLFSAISASLRLPVPITSGLHLIPNSRQRSSFPLKSPA